MDSSSIETLLLSVESKPMTVEKIKTGVRRNGKPLTDVQPDPDQVVPLSAGGEPEETPPQPEPTEADKEVSRAMSRDIVAQQMALWDECIDIDRQLTSAATLGYVGIGRRLQDSINLFKSSLKKEAWSKQRSKTMTRFSAYYEDQTGKTAQPYAWLLVHALSELGTDEARAIMEDESDPIANESLYRVASTFLHYSKADDAYTLRPELADLLTETLAKIRDEGLNLTAVGKELDRLVFEYMDASSAEVKERKLKDKADRFKAIGSMFDRLAKFARDNQVTEPEILHGLRSRDLLSGGVNVIDPETMTHHEAAALAKRLVDMDRTAEIHVMLRAFQAYSLGASNPSKLAPSARPELNDAPRSERRNGKGPIFKFRKRRA